MPVREEERLLLIDTCGETASVALSFGARVIAAEMLEPGRASATILSAVRRLLAETGYSLADLNAVSVVSGPGSFTGMRTGLAVAKGLCEAAGLPMAAVSRLEVLADAAGLEDGFAVLAAGRGDLYVREIGSQSSREFLCVDGDVEAVFCCDRSIVAGDSRSAERLAAHGAVSRCINVADALPVALKAVRAGGEDAARVEANYVRREQDIYVRKIVP